MPDVDRVRPYRRANPPSIPDNGKYAADEFRRIDISVGTIRDVLALLEKRIRVLEPP